MREREQGILLEAVNAPTTDAHPPRLAYPYDFIKALCQVALDQEKRIETLERQAKTGEFPETGY